MRCPSCDHGEMEEKIVDKTLSYGGCSTTLSGMKGQFCPNCGDGVWDTQSYKRFTKAQADLVNTVRKTVGVDIRRIRKRLNLTQESLAKILGFGKLAFSRYEQGKTRPLDAVVKLLKLIDDDPKLLEKVRKMDPPCMVTPKAMGKSTRRKRVAD
jgi:HTH-type transcriptional regulator/antitoxin MqsA